MKQRFIIASALAVSALGAACWDQLTALVFKITGKQCTQLRTTQ